MKEKLLSIHEFMLAISRIVVKIFLIVFPLALVFILMIPSILAIVPILYLMWGYPIGYTWLFIPLAIFSGYVTYAWMGVMSQITDIPFPIDKYDK